MSKQVDSAQAKPTAPQFLFGFKDRTGKICIPAKFEAVGEFEGLFAKARIGNKWGVISQLGEWVVEPRFEFISKIENGHIIFRVANKFGLVSLKGEEIAKAEFDEVVSVGKTVFTVKKENLFKILDFKGGIVIEGLERAFRWSDGFSIAVKNGNGGMIDEKGQWLIGPSENPIYDFSEGMAAFEKEGLSGYYDLSGKVAIEPKFLEAYDFSEGLARVKMTDGYGYIDKSGAIVIPCEWGDPVKINFSGDNEETTRFRNGYAKSAKSGGTRLIAGYLDKAGKWYDKTAFPSDPRDRRELLSFRESNLEWQKQQESIDLGEEFFSKLNKFKEKLSQSFDKDEAATVKVISEVLSKPIDPTAKWLRFTVYDMNDYGLVVTPVASAGKELDNLLEGNPFKSVAKLYESGVMEEPKSPKGIEELGKFVEACALEHLTWFAGLWNKNGGSVLKIPGYVQNEDASFLLDLQTKKRVSEKEILAR